MGAYLLAYAEEYDYEVYYWRDHNDEVDFIVDVDGELTAIEVKSGRRGMNKGLPLFQAKFHPHHALVVGTNGIALEDFFSANVMDILV